MDAFASESFRARAHACLSSRGRSRSACANTCPLMHLLCPHSKLWAKWPRDYLHWKTLESTARRMQLQRFPLGEREETRYAGPRASEAPRGSWRVQEVAMFALSTGPLCLPPAARPEAPAQPQSLTRDGLFLSISRRGYVYKVTFNVSAAMWQSSHVYWTMLELCLESLMGQYLSPQILGAVWDGRNLFAQQVTRSSLPAAFKLRPRKTASRGVLRPSSERRGTLACPATGPWRRHGRDSKGSCVTLGHSLHPELSRSGTCRATTDTGGSVSADHGPLRRERKHLKPDRFCPR